MAADVRQAQQSRIVDQHSEHAATARKAPDRPLSGIVDAAGQEPLELATLRIEHADGRVPRPRQLAGNVEHTVQDGLDIVLRDQRASDLQQP